jgi:carboxyl-terminal processing protease
MKRYRKLALVALALVSALILTVRRHRMTDDKLGLSLDTGDPTHADSTLAAAAGFDLASLQDTELTLRRIKDDYVDPTRIDPQGMLLSALDAVQKDVAEVMVQPSADKSQVTVQVLDAKQTFDISDVDSLWALNDKLKEIFQFVQPNLAPGTDVKTLQNIEFTAINGMLETLDPHSTLLDPETYTEMKIQTKGSFGGIGVTLGMRTGNLTVISVLPGDTPANKVGLLANDRIMAINDESTVNMTLQDAVDRLRGDPGSDVHIKVARDGTTDLLPMTLTRAVIEVHSVQGHLLDGGVGYIKLGTPTTGFAQNTADELTEQMTQLKAQGAHAWILDLRGNPGGLLDQAIRVGDVFIKNGALVTTVGYGGKKREEKDASGQGGEPGPMAVLVDGRSASASEIVAGALKNDDRAVIIGQRTFGKGSVQILYDNADGSALKLTIAQYLTPGDISIQSVGITPDIELDPVNIPLQPDDAKDVVQFFKQPKVQHEWDYDAHLTNKSARHHEQPLETVQFLKDHPTPDTVAAASAPTAPPPTQQPKPAPGAPPGAPQVGQATPPPASSDDDDSEDTPPPDPIDELDPAKWKPDFAVTFADQVLAQAKSSKRSDVIAETKSAVASIEAGQQSKIDDALGKLGVNWQGGTSSGGAPALTAEFTSDATTGAVAAGSTVTLHAKVTNAGPGTAYQVHATIDSDDPDFKDREFVFGEIKAGETKSWDLPVKVEKDAISRVDALKLMFGEENGAAVSAASDLKLSVQALEQPQFAYAYQLVDDGSQGNGDGLVERGESPTLRVTVKNIGTGQSFKTEATLANQDNQVGVNIDKGRWDLSNLAAGEARTVEFTFNVAPDFAQDQFDLALSVYDETLRDYVTEKIHFPIATATGAPTPQSGKVVVAHDGAQIRGGASTDSPVIGQAAKGAAFPAISMANGFYRVDLGQSQPGFLAASDASPGTGDGAQAIFTPSWQVSPPIIALNMGAGYETAGDTYSLQGSAQSDAGVRDMFVFVSNTDSKIDAKKVYYLANQKGGDPSKLAFSSSIPLWPGSNYVTVVARKDSEVESRQNVVIYKDPPPGWQPAEDADDMESGPDANTP